MSEVSQKLESLNRIESIPTDFPWWQIVEQINLIREQCSQPGQASQGTASNIEIVSKQDLDGLYLGFQKIEAELIKIQPNPNIDPQIFQAPVTAITDQVQAMSEKRDELIKAIDERFNTFELGNLALKFKEQIGNLELERERLSQHLQSSIPEKELEQTVKSLRNSIVKLKKEREQIREAMLAQASANLPSNSEGGVDPSMIELRFKQIFDQLTQYSESLVHDFDTKNETLFNQIATKLENLSVPAETASSGNAADLERQLQEREMGSQILMGTIKELEEELAQAKQGGSAGGDEELIRERDLLLQRIQELENLDSAGSGSDDGMNQYHLLQQDYDKVVKDNEHLLQDLAALKKEIKLKEEGKSSTTGNR